MTIRNVATTLAGLLMVVASTIAGSLIWLLLTAPTSVAGAANGQALGAFNIVVQAVYAVLSGLFRYL